MKHGWNTDGMGFPFPCFIRGSSLRPAPGIAGKKGARYPASMIFGPRLRIGRFSSIPLKKRQIPRPRPAVPRAGIWISRRGTRVPWHGIPVPWGWNPGPVAWDHGSTRWNSDLTAWNRDLSRWNRGSSAWSARFFPGRPRIPAVLLRHQAAGESRRAREVREHLVRGMIGDKEIGLDSDVVSITFAG
jgi:hypothetical protein